MKAARIKNYKIDLGQISKFRLISIFRPSATKQIRALCFG